MLYRILATAPLLLGISLVGCDKPTRGDLTASSPREKISAREKTDAETEDTAEENTPSTDKKTAPPASAEKMTSLKDYLEKHHYKWSDPKESDFPLIIEMKSPPVPEEIKGPFPEDAPWRLKEKAPEKKAGKSSWPW